MMMGNQDSLSRSPRRAARSAPIPIVEDEQVQGMNVIVPMGGIGSRFVKSGYRYPKPLINIVGRPMLFWLIDNLKLQEGDTLWLALMRSVDDEFQIAAKVQQEFKQVKVQPVYLEFETRGAAETLYIVTQHMSELDLQKRTISLDCDTIYFKDILTPSRALPSNASACVFFHDSGVNAVYSYIAMDENDQITGIREKVAISRNANTGAYVFRSGNALRHFSASIIDAGVGVAGEYYTSSIISHMVNQGESFRGIKIATGDFYCVGTPDQLDEFLQIVLQNPGMVKKRRFCFDLDNTLVTMPRVAGDYSTCEPKWNNVNLLKQLKAAGHHIIIATARRMRTHNGNIGAVIADIGMVTIKQLEALGIEYDELHFGKPYAHLYIDDLAVSALLDTGKEVGWYAPHEKKAAAARGPAAVAARSFNMVQNVGDKVIKSSSAASIDGEAFFYVHAPEDVKGLLPPLYAVDYNADTRQTSISMGKVQGVTFSHLTVGAGLTPGRMQLMLDTLRQLHSSSGVKTTPSLATKALWSNSKVTLDTDGSEKIDIYSNYHEKAVSRVRTYAHVYEELGFDYNSALETLVQYFEGYQRDNRGIPSKVIHGDPVFSNVLITKDSQIKFIDMRGRVGNTLTLQGDALYDLAKVYQSIRGYDFIILDRDREGAQRRMEPLRQLFWNWIAQTYAKDLGRDADELRQDITAATALLVFTLIPLHDNTEHHRQFARFFTDLMSEAGLAY